MPAMYTRLLQLPNHSFFLFGPRSTGKTTWLREKLGDALWFNLLLDRDYLPLAQNPGLFRTRVRSSPQDRRVPKVRECPTNPGLLTCTHQRAPKQSGSPTSRLRFRLLLQPSRDRNPYSSL